MPTKDSPKARPDNATGARPQHSQAVPDSAKNKPTPATSDKNNDGKGDWGQQRAKDREAETNNKP